MKAALLLMGLLLLSDEAFAGWYHVENFTGTIGSYPVHLSLQTYDSFGSGLSVEGSYYYDSKDSPIPLYGTVTGGKFSLCEISDANEFKILVVGSKTPVDVSACPFSFELKDGAATGLWSKGTAKLPIALRRVASLDDTDDPKIEGQMDIPFWTQTSRDMFVGTYARIDDDLCMVEMNIIEKASKSPEQKIEFDRDDCNAGMVMTPIYMNVEQGSGKAASSLSVHLRDGRMGHDEIYTYNPTTHKYTAKN